jgi:hypothetical protein
MLIYRAIYVYVSQGFSYPDKYFMQFSFLSSVLYSKSVSLSFTGLSNHVVIKCTNGSHNSFLSVRPKYILLVNLFSNSSDLLLVLQILLLRSNILWSIQHSWYTLRHSLPEKEFRHLISYYFQGIFVLK